MQKKINKDKPLAAFYRDAERHFLPAVSVDNVIFGFHDNALKVLLLHLDAVGAWGLPGGHVFKEESIEDAAVRILRGRTSLKNLFLQQFFVFGSADRTRHDVLRKVLAPFDAVQSRDNWLMQRFISIGYYALVEYEKVSPQPDEFSSQCTWHNLAELPALIFDHREIIEKALQALRLQISYQPIGYNLLPKEFTLKNLQVIYETILGRKLDRGNFNKKVLGYGILEKKEKLFLGGRHKAPYLYSFIKGKYFQALRDGLVKDF